MHKFFADLSLLLSYLPAPYLPSSGLISRTTCAVFREAVNVATRDYYKNMTSRIMEEPVNGRVVTRIKIHLEADNANEHAAKSSLHPVGRFRII